MPDASLAGSVGEQVNPGSGDAGAVSSPATRTSASVTAPVLVAVTA